MKELEYQIKSLKEEVHQLVLEVKYGDKIIEKLIKENNKLKKRGKTKCKLKTIDVVANQYKNTK